jgi:hypothetical protein
MGNKIASYYLESPVFLTMTQSEKIKTITLEELLLTDHAQYLRDDSRIEDIDEFIFVLACLTYWNVDKLPSIIYDYIEKINIYIGRRINRNKHIEHKTFNYIRQYKSNYYLG